MKFKYNYAYLNIFSTFATSRKEGKPEQFWQTAYQDLVSTKYPDHKQIFTDGSCQGDLVGSGVWSSNSIISAKLPKSSSVSTVELHAIYIALKKVQKQQGPFLLLTDSLSSINAIRNPNRSKNYIVSDIIKILLCEAGNVAMEWVPSHVGIKGNENADYIANIAAKLALTKDIPRTQREMRRHINDSCAEEWKKNWKTLGTLTKFKPEIGPIDYVSEKRKTQVILTRLRLGITLLTHGHYYKDSEPQKCPRCTNCATLRHIFLQCPAMTSERAPIAAFCYENNIPLDIPNIFCPPTPASIIMKFLEETAITSLI